MASASPEWGPAKTERLVEPSTELVEGFQEKWKMAVADSEGIRRAETFTLDIDAIQQDSSFHRFISEYKGTLKDGKSNLSFTVTSPHDDNGAIKSLSVKIKAPGAPAANIEWTPKEGQNGTAAFQLLRENLPVPILVGPGGSLRMNGVDMAESPLKVTPEGNISPKQLGTAQDLKNLIGKEDLGIKISFSPPSNELTKKESVGNAIRNLWYLILGQWDDVKLMRSELRTVMKQDPQKFVLAAGFNDPDFMGVKELKTALQKISFNSIENNNQKKPSAISPSKKLGQGIYEFVRAGAELITDFLHGTWEAVVGTTVAVGQWIAPALPFIPAITKALSPAGAIAGAVLLSGSFIALIRETIRGNPKGGADLFINSTPHKIINAWKAFGVLFSDDVRAFGQKDIKQTIRQSLMSIIAMVPVLGNLVPGPKTQFETVAAFAHTRGMHENDQLTTKLRGQELADTIGHNFSTKAINLEYEYGTAFTRN